MTDIVPLIRRMTEDLRALQDAMQEAKDQQRCGVHEHLLEQIISTQLVDEFKGALDQMRYFLWCYIEDFATRHCNGGLDAGMASNRLQLVSEMLRNLSQRAAPVSSTPPETMSFFERVDSMVSERLQRGGPKGKLENDAA